MTSVEHTLLEMFHHLVRKHPQLARAHRQIAATIEEEASATVQATEFGFTFKAPPYLNYETFELEEQAFIKNEFPSFDTVINIGANVGFYTCLALHYKKKVLAFEPVPTNCKFLLENICVNGWQEQCRVYQCAIGLNSRVVEIFGEGTGASLISGWAGGSSLVTRVPQYPLNDFEPLIQTPCLFIVDVEGFELSLLQGAGKILSQELAHTWLVEIMINQHQPAGTEINPYLQETFDIMKSFGYRASFMSGEAICDEAILDWQNNVNIPATHNFVFRKL